MPSDIDPMAQAQVEGEILRMVRELTDQTIDNARAAEEAARADVDYDLAYAKALLAQPRVYDGDKVTVAEREARALIAVEIHAERRKLTEAVYRATQERGRNLRAQLDALRSINTNVRGAVQHGY